MRDSNILGAPPGVCVLAQSLDCAPSEAKTSPFSNFLVLTLSAQDFTFGEVLLNYGACFCTWTEARKVYRTELAAHPDNPPPFPEFRSTFPVFYFINDFEHAIKFLA